MNITSDTVEQLVGISVCLTLAGGALYAVFKGNPGVDGYEWHSDRLAWRRRPEPPQERPQPRRTAE